MSEIGHLLKLRTSHGLSRAQMAGDDCALSAGVEKVSAADDAGGRRDTDRPVAQLENSLDGDVLSNFSAGGHRFSKQQRVEVRPRQVDGRESGQESLIECEAR